MKELGGCLTSSKEESKQHDLCSQVNVGTITNGDKTGFSMGCVCVCVEVS